MATIPLKKEKSFRFERWTNAKLVGNFNLIVPPEKYSIKEMPRHSLNRVFTQSTSEDNIVIDEFGDDNKVIKLSGNTGSTDVKFGWTDNYFKGNLTGQQAMLQFQREFIRWKKLKLYQSGLIDRNNIEFRLINYFDEESYVIYITKFEMNKSAQKPLFYNYDIEMITIREVNGEEPNFLRKMLEAVQKVRDIVGKAKASVDRVKQLLTDNAIINTYKESLALANETIESIEYVIDAIDDTAAEVMPAQIRALNETLVNISANCKSLANNVVLDDFSREWRNMETSWNNVKSAYKLPDKQSGKSAFDKANASSLATSNSSTSLSQAATNVIDKNTFEPVTIPADPNKVEYIPTPNEYIESQ